MRNNLLQEFSFIAETYFVSAFLAAFFTTTFAGRLLPKEPLKRLPFAVFLSPLPMVISLFNDRNAAKLRMYKVEHKKSKKQKTFPAFFKHVIH